MCKLRHRLTSKTLYGIPYVPVTPCGSKKSNIRKCVFKKSH